MKLFSQNFFSEDAARSSRRCGEAFTTTNLFSLWKHSSTAPSIPSCSSYECVLQVSHKAILSNNDPLYDSFKILNPVEKPHDPVLLQFQGNAARNGIVARRDSDVKSSFGLYKNLILKEAAESPRAFRESNWVIPVQFDALVVDCDLFISVISSIRNRPRLVLKIFRWAEGQKGLRRSEFVFCSVLEVLVRCGFLRSAYWVLEKGVDVNLHGIVDVLVDGYLSDEVTGRVVEK